MAKKPKPPPPTSRDIYQTANARDGQDCASSRVTSGPPATASVVTEIIGPAIKVERDRIADWLKSATRVGHRALTRNDTT